MGSSSYLISSLAAGSEVAALRPRICRIMGRSSFPKECGHSVRVDEVIGLADLPEPGTRVDVLLNIDPAGGEPTTRLILENIETLASGTTVQNTNGPPLTVNVATLLLTSAQADRLILAAREGRIQLALVNTFDPAVPRP